MTTISARVVADSRSGAGHRLTTLQLRYPRWIHAEQRTHRQLCTSEEYVTPSLMEDPNLSRNASSSRAIPVSRMIEDVLRDPAVPIHWGKNQPGMQAREEFSPEEIDALTVQWLKDRDDAVAKARWWTERGAHKQIVNRILEPYSHINVVVTASNWSNFFSLRLHEDAEPHIRTLARAILQAMQGSKPKLLLPGEWHVPYYGKGHWMGGESAPHSLEDALKVSVARCARVSYFTHDGRKSTIEEDIALAERLLRDAHMSPFEQQATPDSLVMGYDVKDGATYDWSKPHQHGNFTGFIQFRKTLPGECR